MLAWLLAMIHLHTKFEVSSFNRSGDRRGSKILKEGHVIRATPTFGGIFFLSVSTCQCHDAPT